MTKSEKIKMNKSAGDEVNLPCTKCSGKPFHKVLLSLDKDGEEKAAEFEYYWSSSYQIVECQGCKSHSFRKINSNSEDYEQIGDNDFQTVIYENLYPSRVEGRHGIGNDTYRLPYKVQRIYKETLQALNSQSPVLAGIGLRALVETVCKEESATGKNLSEEIDGLVEKKILTPAGAKILHKIRSFGNKAAHEVKPHNDKQLGIAMNVVEHLLRDVYIIPAQVAAEFADGE